MAQPKSRLRFRLRTLFLLVMAIGVPLAAWRAWVEPYRVQRPAMRAIAKAGGHYQTFTTGPAWLRWIFGEGSFQEVAYVDLGQGADAEVFEHLFDFRRLNFLYVDCRAFTDDHLARLSRFPKLKTAILIRTSVSRESVEALERERPDIALTIRLTFEELATVAPGGPWTTDSTRQLGVPMSVRQWVGRRVEIVGQPGIDSYDTVAEKHFELGPIWSDIRPGRGVAVVLRSAVNEDWYKWYEAEGYVGAKGILDIAPDLSDYGTSVYRLSDATLSIAYDAERVRWWLERDQR